MLERGGGGADGMHDVPSSATVTRGVNSVHSLALSLTGMRTGIGFRHWNRVDGSKCEHCLQQWSSALHFGQLPENRAHQCRYSQRHGG